MTLVLTEEQIAELQRILQSLVPIERLEQVDALDLLMKGAVLTLEQEASAESIDALEQVVLSAPPPAIRRLALASLTRLALREKREAVLSLYRLAVERDHAEARQEILTYRFTAPDERLRVLFTFLYSDTTEFQALDPNNEQLTAFYLSETQPSILDRLQKSARRREMEGWIGMVTALKEPTAEAMEQMVRLFGALTRTERRLALDHLARLAADGLVPVQHAIAEICVRYESTYACKLALDNSYQPAEPARQALFLFLTEQWDALEALDFSHRLLNSAYEAADTDLRQRILAHSRYSGQIEWLSASQGRKIRWLKDLNDADWQTTIDQLNHQQRWEDLVKLAQAAPPLWSAEILIQLSEAASPLPDADPELMENLVELARRAQPQVLTIRPRRQMTARSPVTALAISPNGRLLAAGGPDPFVQLWRFPHIIEDEPLSGPIAQTRALDFSPNSETLICAGGDNILRIFRLEDNQLVKALAGHTRLVRSLCVHPDGRTVFSASFDSTVRAWRYPLGPEVRRFESSTGELFGLALSDHGNALLAAGSDQKVHVWKWPEAVETRQLSGPTDAITGLAAAPEGQLVAAYSRERAIYIWNHTTGRLLQKIGVSDDPVTALSLHPNQQLLFTASYSGRLAVWNVSTGQLLAEMSAQMEPVTALLVQKDENLLISSAGREITFWNLESLLLTRQPVETTSPSQMVALQEKLRTAALSPAEKAWLTFTLELLRWKSRFDIELGEPQVVQLQEFDIQL